MRMNGRQTTRMGPNSMAWQVGRALGVAFWSICHILVLAFPVPLSANPNPYSIGNLNVFETCEDFEKAPDGVATIYSMIQDQPLNQKQKRSLLVFDEEIPPEFHVVGAPILGVIENWVAMVVQAFALRDGTICTRIFHSEDLTSKESLRVTTPRQPITIPLEAIKIMESHGRYCAPFYGTPKADTNYCFLPMSLGPQSSFTLEDCRVQSGKVRLLQFSIELGNRTYIATTIDDYFNIEEKN
jgi:hypothetical protein